MVFCFGLVLKGSLRSLTLQGYYTDVSSHLERSDLMAIFSGLFLVLAAAVAIALLRPLLGLVAKLLAGVFLASVGGVVLGLAAETQWPGVGALVGLFAAALCLVPGMRLAWSLGNAAPAPTDNMTLRQHSPVTRPASAPGLEPAGDESVAAAWERALGLIPQEQAKLSEARRSCAALLQLHSTAAPADHEVIDAATLIRRHVPPLIRDTEKACRGADPDERRLLLAQLVGQLQTLADRADALTERAKQQAREELALRHAHLRNRLSEMSGACNSQALQPVYEVNDKNVADRRSAGASTTWWSWLARPLTMWR